MQDEQDYFRSVCFDLKEKIDCAVDRRMILAINEARTADPFVKDLLKYIQKILRSGGKRLRPMMVVNGYRAFGGRNTEDIVRASVSVELIHIYLLIHDDIIDRDTMRHGCKTIHELYRVRCKNLFPKYDASHFGESIAIIAGDLMSALGHRALYESSFAPERIVRALNYLQKTVLRTIVGQTQDVLVEYRRISDEESILKMYENKTARYTMQGPFALGAILAGAKEDEVGKCEKFTMPLGIAFQLRDDLIGMFETSETIGKNAGSDLREGKYTLLVHRARKRANMRQKKRIRALLGSSANEEELEEFRSILRETGALEYVQKKMDGFVSHSVKEIKRSKFDEETKNFLLGLSEYIIKRKV